MKTAAPLTTRTASTTPASRRPWCVAAAHDRAEQEADRVAQHALPTRQTGLHASATALTGPRARVGLGASPTTADAARVLDHPGAPLEPRLRDDMSERF